MAVVCLLGILTLAAFPMVAAEPPAGAPAPEEIRHQHWEFSEECFRMGPVFGKCKLIWY